jgi:hypothetical protein
MGSCAAPSAKGDDKFITTDYLQQWGISLAQCFQAVLQFQRTFFVALWAATRSDPDRFAHIQLLLVRQPGAPHPEDA